VKERPILFSAPMVRALLAGTKTQTRRIVKGNEYFGPYVKSVWKVDANVFRMEGDQPIDAILHGNAVTFLDVRCPYGQVGDRLYVRETWQHSNWPDGPYDDDCDIFYRADYMDDPHGPDGELSPKGKYRVWSPSIHMPRAASRILLEVVSVRVERLQSISEVDSIAEGCDDPAKLTLAPGRICYASAHWEYSALWESINGAGSWAANPWVWVVEFRRI
jgi:hypothetical protein